MQIIDSLRPFTQSIWKNFSDNEKNIFIRRYLSVWNKHRHRIAPACGHFLSELLNNGQLIVTQARPKTADCVINCTGHDFRILKRKDRLVHNLLKSGLVKPDSLGLGFACDKDFCVDSKKMHALGTVLIGELFETIAVREVREQAERIASIIS